MTSKNYEKGLPTEQAITQNCTTNISINNYGNINIYGCDCSNDKPASCNEQQSSCDCIPVAKGHKVKRSIEDRFKPLMENAIPSEVTGGFIHALRRYTSGFTPENGLEKQLFTSLRQHSTSIQNVLKCIVETFDDLAPDIKKKLFGDIANNNVAIPLNPNGIVQALKDEIRQRSLFDTFGDEECFDNPHPGLRRAVPQGDFGEFANPSVFRVNSLRTADFKPAMSIDEYESQEIEQVCRLNTSDPIRGLECRSRSIIEDNACRGRVVDDTCMTVLEVIPGEEVLLTGVNFFNSDARVVITANDGLYTQEVQAFVCGDQVTPLDDGGDIIDDSRVSDQIVFVVPIDIPSGVYNFVVSFVDNIVPEPQNVRSQPQFLEVVPPRDTMFRLSAVDLICTEETDGLGSDEVALNFFVGSIASDGSIASPRIIIRRFDDVDSGESREIDRVLFEGANLNAVFVALIGFEVDNERAYREQIESIGEAFILYWTILFDGVADAWDPIGGNFFSFILLHGWWGGLTSIFTQALATFWSLYAPADLILHDRIIWTASDIERALRTDVPIPARSTESANGIDVSISLQIRNEGQYFEQRTYRSDDEDSTYQVTYRLE